MSYETKKSFLTLEYLFQYLISHCCNKTSAGKIVQKKTTKQFLSSLIIDMKPKTRNSKSAFYRSFANFHLSSFIQNLSTHLCMLFWSSSKVWSNFETMYRKPRNENMTARLLSQQMVHSTSNDSLEQSVYYNKGDLSMKTAVFKDQQSSPQEYILKQLWSDV